MLPKYDHPFVFGAEQVGTAVGVLSQSEGQKQKPIAYYSEVLDHVTQGLLKRSSPYSSEN